MVDTNTLSTYFDYDSSPIDWSDGSFRDVVGARCADAGSVVGVRTAPESGCLYLVPDDGGGKPIRVVLASIVSCTFYLNDDVTCVELLVSDRTTRSVLLFTETSNRDESNELFQLAQDVAGECGIKPMNIVDENSYGMVLIDDDEYEQQETTDNTYDDAATTGSGDMWDWLGPIQENGATTVNNDGTMMGGFEPEYGGASGYAPYQQVPDFSDADFGDTDFGEFSDSFEDDFGADAGMTQPMPHNALRDAASASGNLDSGDDAAMSDVGFEYQPGQVNDAIDSLIASDGNEKSVDDVIDGLLPKPDEISFDSIIDSLAPDSGSDSELDVSEFMKSQMAKIDEIKPHDIVDIDGLSTSKVIDTSDGDSEYASFDFDPNEFDVTGLTDEINKKADEERQKARHAKELADRIKSLATAMEERLGEQTDTSFLTEKIARMHEYNKTLHEALDKERARIRQLTAERDQIQSQYDAQSAIAEQLERDIKSAAEEHLKAKQYIEDARQQVANIIAEATAKVNSANASTDAMRAKFTEEHDKRISLERTFGQKLQQFSESEKASQERIEQLTGELDAANQKVIDIQGTVNDMTAQMESAFKQADAAQSAEARAKRSEERTKTEMKALRIRLDAISDEKARLEAKVSSTETQLDTAMRHNEELNGELSRLNAEIDENAAMVDAANADYDVLNQKYQFTLGLYNEDRRRVTDIVSMIGSAVGAARARRGWISKRELADITEKFDEIRAYLNDNSAPDDGIDSADGSMTDTTVTSAITDGEVDDEFDFDDADFQGGRSFTEAFDVIGGPAVNFADDLDMPEDGTDASVNSNPMDTGTISGILALDDEEIPSNYAVPVDDGTDDGIDVTDVVTGDADTDYGSDGGDDTDEFGEIVWDDISDDDSDVDSDDFGDEDFDDVVDGDDADEVTDGDGGNEEQPK